MAALIRACLVAGYGNIAIDGITVAGGIATATITNNTLEVGTVIEISGATPAELNAEWKITAADSGSVTFATPGIADVTATGTIGASIPAAGWEEPYAESGNYACFRALEGVRQFYQIDDNQADSDIAVARSYDSMADALSGTGLRAEHNFGKWHDSNYSKKWVILADEKTCYVALQGYSASTLSYGMMRLHGFGEFFSYVVNDPYKYFLAGHSFTSGLAEGASKVGLGCCSFLGENTDNSAFSIGSTMRAEAGAKAVIAAITNFYISYTVDSGELPVDVPGQDTVSALTPVRFYAHNPTLERVFRGHLRGAYTPGRRFVWTDESGDYKWDVCEFGGKPFFVLPHGSASNWAGPFVFDLTSWDEGV
jgi:hypothetical protein